MATIKLIDANGKTVKKIYNGKIESLPFSKEIDTATLPKGVYFLQLGLEGKKAIGKNCTLTLGANHQLRLMSDAMGIGICIR